MLATCAPNPFNPRANARFHLEKSGPIQISVYDVRGAAIRHLLDRTLPAGEHIVTWDGLDHRGRTVPAGTYFLRLTTDTERRIRKMMLVR